LGHSKSQQDEDILTGVNMANSQGKINVYNLAGMSPSDFAFFLIPPYSSQIGC